MADLLSATTAIVRLVAGRDPVAVATASIDLLRAMRPSDDTGQQLLDEIRDMKAEDFPVGIRSLERATQATQPAYRDDCLFEAARCFRRALHRDPSGLQRALVEYYSGVVHVLIGEPQIAAREFDAARELVARFDELERVLQTERRVQHEWDRIARPLGLSSRAPVRERTWALAKTYFTYRYLKLLVAIPKYARTTRDDRRYLRSDAALAARAHFGVAEDVDRIPPDIRRFVAALRDLPAGSQIDTVEVRLPQDIAGFQ